MQREADERPEDAQLDRRALRARRGAAQDDRQQRKREQRPDEARVEQRLQVLVVRLADPLRLPDRLVPGVRRREGVEPGAEEREAGERNLVSIMVFGTGFICPDDAPGWEAAFDEVYGS